MKCETRTQTDVVGRIQVLSVLLVADDTTAIYSELLLLVLLSRFSHETLPLTVPVSGRDMLIHGN